MCADLRACAHFTGASRQQAQRARKGDREPMSLCYMSLHSPLNVLQRTELNPSVKSTATQGSAQPNLRRLQSTNKHQQLFNDTRCGTSLVVMRLGLQTCTRQAAHGDPKVHNQHTGSPLLMSASVSQALFASGVGSPQLAHNASCNRALRAPTLNPMA